MRPVDPALPAQGTEGDEGWLEDDWDSSGKEDDDSAMAARGRGNGHAEQGQRAKAGAVVGGGMAKVR